MVSALEVCLSERVKQLSYYRPSSGGSVKTFLLLNHSNVFTLGFQWSRLLGGRFRETVVFGSLLADVCKKNKCSNDSRHLLLLHIGKTHDTKRNDRFCPQSHAVTEKLLNICKLRALRSKWYFQWIFGLFSSSRIVNYNFMKNEGFSVISVWILACLPVAGAACWN